MKNLGANPARKSFPVVVITAHREIYFGYANTRCPKGPKINLAHARMAVYYATDVRGVVGLAVNGPSPQSRITAAVDQIVINSAITILTATDRAAQAWEGAPWRS